MSDSENKAGCSPVGARGKNLSLSQVEIEQLVDSITPEERHAIVDGLFDWFLGREHKLGGMTGTVLTIMIEKQVAYQAVCAARAKAGRKGGLIGGKASGEVKARYGNQNAKQNGPEGENAKQTQSKRKANAKQTQSKISPLDPPIQVQTLPGNNNITTGIIPARTAPALALARETPTLEQVLAYAKDAAHHPSGTIYPEDWAREFFILNEEAEPKWTKKTGEFIGRNWRQEMIYAWKRHLRYDTQRQASGQQPAGVKLGVSDKFDFTRFGEN